MYRMGLQKKLPTIAQITGKHAAICVVLYMLPVIATVISRLKELRGKILYNTWVSQRLSFRVNSQMILQISF
jgi:hypothetical protein